MRSIPNHGCAPNSILSNSTCTRSTVIRWISEAKSVMAARTRSLTANPNWELNRATRSNRNGSSAKLWSGAAGVSITPFMRSANPPMGSKNSNSAAAGVVPTASGTDVISTAMALIVKSRRTKSPANVSPNTTSGLRDSPS